MTSIMEIFRSLLWVQKSRVGSILRQSRGVCRELAPLVVARSLATAPAAARDPPVKRCSIRKLEANQKLLKTKTTPQTAAMDKCVKFILNRDIQVSEVSLMLDKRIRVKTLRNSILTNSKSDRNNIPTEMKIGKFNPKDDETIKINMESLLKGVKLSKHEDEVLNQILSLSVEDDHLKKLNVIGLWLSQGLEDIRLPCDVAHRARRLYTSSRNKEFTEEEDEMIMTFMETEGADTRQPWAHLSAKLRRSAQTIESHFRNALQHENKRKVGKFSAAEDELIMKAVFKLDENALDNVLGVSQNVWNVLGEKLNRRPKNIYSHWGTFIQPHLVRYNAGVHEDDIMDKLVDYCVNNGIKFRQDADWAAIAR